MATTGADVLIETLIAWGVNVGVVLSAGLCLRRLGVVLRALGLSIVKLLLQRFAFLALLHAYRFSFSLWVSLAIFEITLTLSQIRLQAREWKHPSAKES